MKRRAGGVAKDWMPSSWEGAFRFASLILTTLSLGAGRANSHIMSRSSLGNSLKSGNKSNSELADILGGTS